MPRKSLIRTVAAWLLLSATVSALEQRQPTTTTEASERAAVLAGTICSPGGFSASHNGQPIAHATGDTKTMVTVNLVCGENDLVVECAPAARIQLVADGLPITTDEPWEIAQADGKTWSIGRPTEQNATRVTLRRTILVRRTPELYSGYYPWYPNTRYFDVPYTICRGSAQLLIHRQFNPMTRALRGVRAIIDLPSGFTLMDTNCRTGIAASGNTPRWEKLPDAIRRGGLAYTRYVLSFPTELKPGDNESGKYYAWYTAYLVVKAEKDAPEQATFYARQTAEEGTVTTLEKALAVEVFPELKATPKPGRHFQLVDERSLPYLGDEEVDALLDTFRHAGIDELEFQTTRTGYFDDGYVRRLKDIIRRLHGRGMKAMIMQWEDWGRDKFIFDGKPEHSARLADGALARQEINMANCGPEVPCPTYLIGEGRQPVVDQIAQTIKEYDADGYIRSTEGVGAVDYCFCPRCVEAFRARIGAAGDAALTPDVIRTRHAEPWTDFRRWQHGQLQGIVRDGVHKAGANKVCFAYGPLQSKMALESYLTDWRYYRDNTDIAIAGICGAIEWTKKALGPTPWMGRVGVYDSPPKKANSLIYDQFIASGGLGVRIFQHRQMTGSTLYLISLLDRFGADAKDKMPEGYQVPVVSYFHTYGYHPE